MRIMIVIAGLQSGGAERVATLWANSFCELGHEVVLATNKSMSDAPFIYPIHKDVQVVKCFGLGDDSHLKQTNVFNRAFKALQRKIDVHFALRKEIKSFHPDVAISLMQPTSTQTMMAALGIPCPVIATEHNAFERPLETPLNWRQKFFKFIANKWFPMVTVLTEADLDFIGDRLNNVYVMPNPLSLEPLQNNATIRKKRIVASGRLDAWYYKGFDLLICAWGKIADKYPEWTLDISGESFSADGKSKAYLEHLIHENNLDGRCFLSGFHSDMAKYFRESEIFVLSSRYEGFGLVLIEAMSQGCACIAADYKGRQSEIIRDNSEGLCIPTDDEAALIKAMEEMIHTETYRKKVQRKAILRSLDYLPLAIARRWELLINDVLEKS